MTIRRRILLGHLILWGLLLILGCYGVFRLRAAVDLKEQDRKRLETFSQLQTLSHDLDRIIELHGLWVELGDPDFEREFRKALDPAKSNYKLIRAQLLPETKLPKLEWLFLGPVSPGGSKPGTRTPAGPATPQPVPPGPSVATRPETSDAPSEGQGSTASRKDSGSRLDTAPGPPRGTLSENRARPLDASGLEPWSYRWEQGVRSEWSQVNEQLIKKWDQQTEATSRILHRAKGFAAVLLTTGALVALVSSIWSVVGVRRLLQHLTRATSEIGSGRLDLDLAATGKDEISHISKAINAMSVELAKARRLEADFLAVASHELKTPLALIQAHARMLRSTLPQEAESAKAAGSLAYLDRIEEEVEHLVGKSSELLTLGRIEAGQLKLEAREFMTRGFLIRTAGFSPWTVGAVTITPQRFARRPEIALDPSVPATFTADPDRLEQVLLNLLENALKYTPGGGRVRFSARAVDGALQLEVSDTGPGIPPEKLPLIFDKYERVTSGARDDPGGAGIGLAVARGIVLAHGGTIEAHSTPGSGTRFLVRLPIRRDNVQDKEVA